MATTPDPFGRTRSTLTPKPSVVDTFRPQPENSTRIEEPGRLYRRSQARRSRSTGPSKPSQAQLDKGVQEQQQAQIQESTRAPEVRTGQETTTRPTIEAQQKQIRDRQLVQTSQINQRGIVAPSQKDLDFLKEQKAKKRIDVRDFNKIESTAARVSADVNIRTGAGQGTVTTQDTYRLDLAKSTTDKTTRQETGDLMKTAAVGAGLGLLGPLAPGAVKVGLLASGSFGLLKEFDVISSLRSSKDKDDKREAQFRTKRIFAGLTGVAAGRLGSRPLKANLPKIKKVTTKTLLNVKDKTSDILTIRGKKGRIGGLTAKQRSGRISRGDLRKGKDFRDFQKQKDFQKEMFGRGSKSVRVQEQNILKIDTKNRGDLISNLDKISANKIMQQQGLRQIEIGPTVTQSKQFTVFTKPKVRGGDVLKATFEKRGIAGTFEKPGSAGVVRSVPKPPKGQPGQSPRPRSLFDVKDRDIVQAQERQPFPIIFQKTQSFKPLPASKSFTPKLAPQTTGKTTTILEVRQTPQTTTKTIVLKPTKTPSPIKQQTFDSGFRQQTSQIRGETPSSQTLTLTQTKPPVTQTKGFRPGMRDKLIGRLQTKRDFIRQETLPKPKSDLQGVTPKTKKTEFTRAVSITKGDKALTGLMFPGLDSRQESQLGTINIADSRSATKPASSLDVSRVQEQAPTQDFKQDQKQEENLVIPTPIKIARPRRTRTVKTPTQPPKPDFKPVNLLTKIKTPTPDRRTPRSIFQPPKLPPLGLNLPSFSLKAKGSSLSGGLFSVGIRRRGREQTIATGLTRGQAKLRLRSALDTTLARSGRVRGLGFVNLGSQFRAPKKGSKLPFGSVVEKREFSLSSFGERSEIKRFRKNKRFNIL